MADTSKWLAGKVAGKFRWTEKLYSLRIDAEVEPFRAGQFARLALEVGGELVPRAYSFVNAPRERPHEFYFITVEAGPLTPRLNALAPGDGIWVSPRPSGMLTLSEVPHAPHLWMLSTGTAIGPFLSILREGEVWARFEKVVLVHAVRHAEELTYQDVIHGAAAGREGRFAYVPFVSREHTDFAIRGRVPDAITGGALEERAGIAIAPDASQVMICGNPAMVKDTTVVLEARGLRRNKRKEPGQITIETYW